MLLNIVKSLCVMCLTDDMNHFDDRHKGVAYLDTDVGQPEFTPPGCLSLTIINEPTPGADYYMSPFSINTLSKPPLCLHFIKVLVLIHHLLLPRLDDPLPENTGKVCCRQLIEMVMGSMSYINCRSISDLNDHIALSFSLLKLSDI